MVLGIGEGTIEITTEKQAYASGELLKGTVVLKLSSAVKARALRVRFYGEMPSTRRGGRMRVSVGPYTKRSMQRIEEQELALDGEKEYTPGVCEYPFQFQLPSIQSFKPIEGGGILGNLANMSLQFADVSLRAKWFVDASLDLPMKFDIGKKLQIYISSK